MIPQLHDTILGPAHPPEQEQLAQQQTADQQLRDASQISKNEGWNKPDCNINGNCYQNPISYSSAPLIGNFRIAIVSTTTETNDANRGNLIHVNLNIMNVGKKSTGLDVSQIPLFDSQGGEYRTAPFDAIPSSIMLEAGFQFSAKLTFKVPVMDPSYSLKIEDKYLKLPVEQAIEKERADALKVAQQQAAAQKAEQDRVHYLKKLNMPATGYIEITNATLNPIMKSTVTIHNLLPNTCGGENWCNRVVIDGIYLNGKQVFYIDFGILSGKSTTGKEWSFDTKSFTNHSYSTGTVRVVGHLWDADSEYPLYYQKIYAEYTVK